MKIVRLFNIVLRTSLILSTAIADPFTKNYMEAETAYLTCSTELKEIMEIATIKYEKGTCSHNDLHGIGNLCNGMTESTFNVTNSNVGSSCGANGTASLGVTYNCKLKGSVCRDTKTVWTCLDGYIQIRRANWTASNACGVPGVTSNFDVLRVMRQHCDERNSCTFTANDITFNVSCKELHKTCSQLEYEYKCIKAKWDSWTEWSICSKSCGSGEQERKRNCLNKFNTKDGYLIDCEGSSVETRVCNTIQCPYCDDNNFHYSLSKSFSDLNEDTSPGSGFLLLNGIFAVNCCGRMKMWEFVPVKTGSLTFVILRKTDGHNYKFVGSNQVHISAKDLHKSLQLKVSDDERIVIGQGDIIGWFGSGNNIGYYDCTSTTKPCSLSLRLQNPVNEGDVIDIESLSTLSNRIYAVNYSTTQNRPVTIAISSEPVTIPDHLKLDAFVMTIPIYDPDYGDFIQDFKLDYSNEYFYYDTKLRSVHVKKALPHVVGQKSSILNFTLTVQDSCFNLAKASITIISSNDPPVVTGLMEELSIDPQELQDDSSFHIFNVADPSTDNVSCVFSKTLPPTNVLTLEITGEEAYLHIPDQSTINSTLGYELQILCEDGTDNIEFEITILFRSKIYIHTDIESSRSIKQIIISVCGSIGVIVVLYCIWKWRMIFMTKTRARGRSSRRQYISTIEGDFGVNPYDEIKQNRDQNTPKVYFEMSVPNTTVYENTQPFI